MDSKVRSQQRNAAENKPKSSHDAGNGKSWFFRSVRGSRCWRSHKAKAILTRVAGVWEHKDGRIIPASCSGIEPVRNLQVTEVANYPSRRRWLHGLVVTDYNSYEATNQTERSPVTEIREHLKIPDRKIHDAENHPERFQVADEVQSSDSSSWRELHEDSDPECLIVSEDPDYINRI